MFYEQFPKQKVAYKYRGKDNIYIDDKCFRGFCRKMSNTLASQDEKGESIELLPGGALFESAGAQEAV
jgi:hypothetical protein